MSEVGQVITDRVKAGVVAHPGGTPLGYMPQLDGLRALAVVGVWFEHWGIAQERGFRCVEWGRLAVWLFFVLSGFLITGILLKSKRDVEAGHQGVGRAAKVFYVRRFLRILPIYYLTLFAAAVAVPEVRKAFWWHLTYTTDFWTSLHPDQYPAGVHFWTLAVEEQFYLVWPWIVLLLPWKKLPWVLGMLVVGAIAYRAAIVFLGIPSRAAIAVPMPILGNIDKFAMGGLIAVYQGGGETMRRSWKRLAGVGMWVALPGLILLEASRCVSISGGGVALRGPVESAMTLAFASSIAGLFFVWLVGATAVGIGGPVGKLLSARPLTAMGKISYGLYLFHMFVPGVMQRARIPMPPPWMVWPRFFIYAGVTLVAGFLSWKWIESPVNSLKERYRYTAPATALRE